MKTATSERAAVELELEQQGVRAPAVIEPTRAFEVPSPLDRIADLLSRGITPEQLDNFLEVQRKHEAEQARRAYVAAMAAFKSEPIDEILKTKAVGYTSKRTDTTVAYAHETLDQVVGAVVGPMARHGLSHSWRFQQDHPREGLITVWTVITHRDGHSETVELYAAPDDSGNKNAIQQVGSTIHYLERYGLLGITGLAAKGVDNDGRGATPPGQDPTAGSAPQEPRARAVGDGKATTKQVKLLKVKIERGNVDEAKLLEQFAIAAIEELPFDKVNDALGWIAERASGG